ncbi:SDR family NAD(P)-dependent oxidoreductase [Asaia siamensis]|uniref:NAD(P)-dependent oxidoreductase n=1 Tax=Asaia siamensis TaxID=110479 RepID=A0ABQ1MII8_9PROT|nr:SDR family NAD(P)-dependent oxidoreductase [Asaia siamensis]GBR06900.1 nucleoside-diphosphate-sugar epimerase [Asaia siamensis NRIC 0323]GGC41279.1 NAD(P)-dependent oxidoreductase [Asaia siamensis]
MPPHLVILGQGYSASAVSTLLRAQGWTVTGTKRAPEAESGLKAFDAVETELLSATHLLVSAPPGEAGDPALLRYGAILEEAPHLRWIGYYSTTGVYGDRQGARVDENTSVAPGQTRSAARVKAEQDWQSLATRRGLACDIMRLGGIYGPGRSAFDTLRSGKARLIDAPDHFFSRIHRDDIAEATLAAIETAQGCRILNFVDDTPSPQAAVFEEAARLSGAALPPRLTLEAAWEEMSPMARSFWAERRLVESVLTKQRLNREWRYPSYREGLAAIFDSEENRSAE